jgi:anti-sigma B factor antagonist
MSTQASQDHERPVVVPVLDELVFDSSEAVEQLQELLRAGRTRLVLDMRQTRFVSGIGLGVIADAVRQARRCGGDVKVVAGTRALRRVFEVGELVAVVEFYDDVERACNAFAACVGEIERALLWRQFADE